MKVERIAMSGQVSRHAAISSSVRAAAAGHPLERLGMRVLERNIQVRQHQTLGHQRHQLADMGVGIDVMQAHPGAQ